MFMSTRFSVLGAVEISIFPIMHPNQVGCLYQVVAQILIAGTNTLNIFGLPFAGLLFVPYQTGELGQGLVVLKPGNLANFGQDAGGIDRANPLERSESLRYRLHVLFNELVQFLNFGLQGLNHTGAEGQAGVYRVG